LVYGKSISEAVDPIEKKPLFHFHPGTKIFSIATVGCNFKCLHCQNFSISQVGDDRGEIPGETLGPERIVFLAQQTECESIAYTYTEPTIFLEYAMDTAKLASLGGLKNVFVTNGYVMPEPLQAMKPYLDGANIDLKVIADTDSNIPWHVTQFYPTHRLQNQPRTPVKILELARHVGLEEGLKYVYQGNVPGAGGESTYCPGCGRLLIERLGYTVQTNSIIAGKCPACGETISGLGL
jgi:pyruvate formate lyase activating enzyme